MKVSKSFSLPIELVTKINEIEGLNELCEDLFTKYLNEQAQKTQKDDENPTEIKQKLAENKQKLAKIRKKMQEIDKKRTKSRQIMDFFNKNRFKLMQSYKESGAKIEFREWLEQEFDKT